MDLPTLLEQLRELPAWLGWLTLFGGALIEYIVPPFPGDTVVVAGAALVTVFGWTLWPVFIVVTAGSVTGSALSWAVGRALEGSPLMNRAPGGRILAAVHHLSERFERHGAWYLALNRFLPGVRTFFFIAAGIVGLPLSRVLFWSAISAAVWNSALVGLGFAVGDNVEMLARWVRRYTAIVGIVILGVIIYQGWRTWRLVSGR